MTIWSLGVHSTQFEIRDPKFGLYQPVLALAMDELRSTDANPGGGRFLARRHKPSRKRNSRRAADITRGC